MYLLVDVTEMAKVNFISGIQRVVKEVTTRWIHAGYKMKLLYYDPKKKCYRIVDNDKYYAYYTGQSTDKKFISKEKVQITDFDHNCIFFDMDSVWMNPLKRSFLLPKLKEQGVKIAVHVYDIIPVTEAQYCHEFTTISFLEYIGAYIQFADLIISNAQATLDAMNRLISGIAGLKINGKVVKLGSDIKRTDQKSNVQDRVKEIADRGKYVLMVGTIEPRKNHKYVLEAFEECLFEEGIQLVFAGRIGWNMEDFMERLQKHPQLNKKLFWVNNASDQDIVFLYENTFLVAFPSFNEGFGLPVIEAFDRGALVVAADIPVLREVGGEFCKYCSLSDTGEFTKWVLYYRDHEKEYLTDKEKIRYFKPTTWDECAEEMMKELQKLGGA